MKQDLKGKTLMMMSGSRDACEIVNVAHEMGVTVYETDWYENSPAKKVVDKAFMVSTADVDAMVKLCTEECVNGIISGYTDSVLPYNQQVCERMGLPFWGNRDNIEMCIDKKLFKKACEEAGIPVVPYVKLSDKDYVEKLADITLPVVFKPVDNSGSRGVYKCYKEKDKRNLCEKSLSFSYCKEVLAEKLMNADNEFSAYYILNNGNVRFTAMGDRYVLQPDPEIAPMGQGMLFPSTRLSQWEEEVDPIVRKFFEMNNMKNGFVFIQGFYDEGNFYIHEIGYRLNGGFSFKIVEHFSKYNQIEQMIRFSLTGKMDEEELKKSNPHFDGYGMILTTTLRNGVIGSIKGVDDVQKLEGVNRFFQMHFEGDELTSPGTTAQVFSYTMCVAPTKEKLLDVIRNVEDAIKVLDNNGENMLLPMINPERMIFNK